MALDALTCHDANGVHCHPYMSDHTAALARTETVSRRFRDALGNPVRISHAMTYPCGRDVGTTPPRTPVVE